MTKWITKLIREQGLEISPDAFLDLVVVAVGPFASVTLTQPLMFVKQREIKAIHRFVANSFVKEWTDRYIRNEERKAKNARLKLCNDFPKEDAIKTITSINTTPQKTLDAEVEHDSAETENVAHNFNQMGHQDPKATTIQVAESWENLWTAGDVITQEAVDKFTATTFVDEYGFFELVELEKCIEPLKTKQFLPSLDTIVGLVAAEVTPFAKLLTKESKKSHGFLKQAEINPVYYYQVSDPAAKEYTVECILTINKKLAKVRFPLREDCGEENTCAITRSLNIIQQSGDYTILDDDIQNPQRILETLKTEKVVDPDEFLPIVRKCVAVVVRVLDRFGYFPVLGMLKWIEPSIAKQNSDITLQAFLNVVVIAVKPFARLSSDVPQVLVCQRELGRLQHPNVKPAAHAWATKYIQTFEKWIDHLRSNLRSACEEENVEKITEMLSKIVHSPCCRALEMETAAARKILKAHKENHLSVNQVSVLSDRDLFTEIMSPREIKQKSDDSTTMPLADAIEAVVDEITAITLDWLSNHLFCHVADIARHIRTKSVEGIPTEVIPALVIDRMKLDRRLKYGLDAQGYPVFELAGLISNPAPVKSFIELETTVQCSNDKSSNNGSLHSKPDDSLESAIQSTVEKFAAMANHKQWVVIYVDEIESELSYVPLKYMSKQDYVARIVDRMKHDKRFKYATDSKERAFFELVTAETTVVPPSTRERTKKSSTMKCSVLEAPYSPRSEISEIVSEGSGMNSSPEKKTSLKALEDSQGGATMAAYFQRLMKGEAMIEDAIQVFQEEAMKALEMKSHVFLDDVFNSIEIRLPRGITKDAFIGKLKDGLHYTLEVDRTSYGQPSIVRVSAKHRLPLQRRTASIVAPRFGGAKSCPAFNYANQKFGRKHEDASSDDDDEVKSIEDSVSSGESDQSSDDEYSSQSSNGSGESDQSSDDEYSSQSSIDSGESDQSSDNELGVYLIADDFPRDFLAIQNKIVKYHKIPAAHGDSHRSKRNTAEEYRGSNDTDPCSDEVHEIHGDSSPTDECTTQAKVDSTKNTSDAIKVESISPISEISMDGFARSVAGDAKQDSTLNDAAEPTEVSMPTLTEGPLEPALDAFECAVEEAKDKFTKIALKWLENNAIFRVECIESGIVDCPVDGISRAEFVACIINRMKQDQRLEFVVSSNGSQAFLLSSRFEQREENISQNALDIALQEAVTKFTGIALKWLKTDPYYHVADIKGQTKSSPVQGLSKDDFVARIVDKMKQDKRLTFAIDPKGRQIFKLSNDAPRCSIDLEIAMQGSVAKFTAFALKHLAKQEFFYVANLEGQIKSSPVIGISRDDFVARVVDRMKQGGRLKFDTDFKGRQVFVLARTESVNLQGNTHKSTLETSTTDFPVVEVPTTHHEDASALLADDTATNSDADKKSSKKAKWPFKQNVFTALELSEMHALEILVNKTDEVIVDEPAKIQDSRSSSNMTTYFQSVMQEQSMIEDAIRAFEAEAMKALETKDYVCLDDIFKSTEICLPTGMTRDAFLDKLEDSLHNTLQVDWTCYGQPGIVRAAEKDDHGEPLNQTTTLPSTLRVDGELNEHEDAPSDDDDANSSASSINSGESDQSSDDAFDCEVYPTEDDLPEDFLGIHDKMLLNDNVIVAQDESKRSQDDNEDYGASKDIDLPGHELYENDIGNSPHTDESIGQEKVDGQDDSNMTQDKQSELAMSPHNSQSFVQAEHFEQRAGTKCQNAVDIALKEAVAMFTSSALKWLATDPRYHVADIEGRTKISPVQGVSKDDFVDLIVDTMKQDKRLTFAIDPKGRPVFMLSAVQDTVAKLTAYALKHLVKHDAFHVANIEGQIKASPVTGISRDSFVARVVDRMKQDSRLQFDTDLKGRHVFILARAESTACEPRSVNETPPGKEEESSMLGQASQKPTKHVDDSPQELHLLHKTAICTRWRMKGVCSFGDRCYFAHGEEELRPTPWKTRSYGNGNDTKVHPKDTAKASTERSQVEDKTKTFGASVARTNTGTPSEAPRQKLHPLYKTMLCTRWRNSGGCFHGDRCHFAHGEAELRPKQS
ncbi:unnamed protein product [Aphanomyces euteiches]